MQTSRVTVAEFAKTHGLTASKARYQLDKLVKAGDATRSVAWTSVPSSMHNCRAEFSFRQAVYTIPLRAAKCTPVSVASAGRLLA
jgi:predicted ArsR family transcriptional regulator